MPFRPLPTIPWPTPGTETSTEPPVTPIVCAETPTHASPLRTNSSLTVSYSGFASTPPLTFNHSTTTLPLNFAGSLGRRTRTRVRYAAVAPGSNVQRPSPLSAPFAVYDVAVPDASYSCCTYPGGIASVLAEPMNTPLPPVSSFDRSAAGPAGRAIVDPGVEVDDAVAFDPFVVGA